MTLLLTRRMLSTAPPRPTGRDRRTMTSATADRRLRATPTWSIADFADTPQHSRTTRHSCVQGRSHVGRRGGPRLSEFLHRVGAAPFRACAGFACAHGDRGGIDRPSAPHLRTLITAGGRGQRVEPAGGDPFETRAPTRLGSEPPASLTSLRAADRAGSV